MASIKTTKGREKMAKAHAGQGTLPAITKIAFGSGGVNTDGTLKALTGSENVLFSEKGRKTATVVAQSTTTYRYSITLDATTDSLIGININEAALVDTDGDLIAIKTFTNKGFESGVTLEFDYDAQY